MRLDKAATESSAAAPALTLTRPLHPSEYLNIDECTYKNGGRIKDIYVHQGLPHAVIKIIRPSSVDKYGRFWEHKGLKYRSPTGAYRHFRRELTQYLELCRGYADNRMQFPMATPLGFMPTDRGLALISERIMDRDRDLGPSLEDLIRTRSVTKTHIEALGRLFEECIRLHIIVGDCNTGAMVYTESRGVQPEFVLVDGLGDKNLIPLRTMSWHYNRRKLLKARSRILNEIAEKMPDLASVVPRH
nr:hypothetical protein REQ54_01912 [Rhizobium sp. Q54]